MILKESNNITKITNYVGFCNVIGEKFNSVVEDLLEYDRNIAVEDYTIKYTCDNSNTVSMFVGMFINDEDAMKYIEISGYKIANDIINVYFNCYKGDVEDEDWIMTVDLSKQTITILPKDF